MWFIWALLGKSCFDLSIMFSSTHANKCVFVVFVNAFAHRANLKSDLYYKHVFAPIGWLKNIEQLTCKSVFRISLWACWHSRRQSALSRVNGSAIDDSFHATRTNIKHQNGTKTTTLVGGMGHYKRGEERVQQFRQMNCYLMLLCMARRSIAVLHFDWFPLS